MLLKNAEALVVAGEWSEGSFLLVLNLRKIIWLVFVYEEVYHHQCG